VIAFAKKQEEFMIDANLVCVKLASTHPFIFIRQLPMMEGLLQGRVIYTFEEFKRRKFDKLFHYVIDILNILVPFVFHRVYIEHIQAIISHYFEVFMVNKKRIVLNISNKFFISYLCLQSYCQSNREELGSLVAKFVDFLEKYINNDFELGESLVIQKYSLFIGFLKKSYPEINSLKYLNILDSISSESQKAKPNIESFKSTTNVQSSLTLLKYKKEPSIWSPKILEPFINKLVNRDNLDGNNKPIFFHSVNSLK
jgi:integrator complex subunit 1